MDLTGGNNPGTPKLDTTPQDQPLMNPGIESAAAALDPMAQGGSPTGITLPTAPVLSTYDTTPAGIDGSVMPPKSSGGKAKVIIFVVVGLILVAGLAAGAFFVGNTTGKSEGRKAADAEYQNREAERQRREAESNNQADTSEEQATLELGSDSIDPKYVDETVEGDIGKQLTASDGLVIKVTNIERNFETDDTNYKVAEGKELVKVNFLMGNIAKDKAKDMTNFAFYLESADAARLTPENIASYKGKFDSIKLDPGAQAAGSIVYLVNKDEAPLKFVREQRYRFSGENREVTTRTIVNVAK